MSKLVLAVIVAALLASNVHATPRTHTKESRWRSPEGIEIIGTKAPEFAGLRWVNSEPLTLAALKGKAVLVRFWLGDCDYCRKTVPALNYLQETYAPRGLVVIGIHHPKGATSLKLADKVEARMKEWGMNMSIPVALDNDWQTINRLWTGVPRDYTSASILIDREGVIRWVHPGGILELPPKLGGRGERESSRVFESLQHAIEDALSKKD